MMLFSVLLFFVCTIVSLANQSIFLLGDSVSAKLFADGFMQVFRCTQVDPNIVFSAETTKTYSQDRGRICTEHNVTRIGYMIHFGVFDSIYHENYHTHVPMNATENSRTNIKMAMSEFQNRTKDTDDSVLFMFHSSLWDIKRYMEHRGLYRDELDWESKFQDEYTSLMLELRKMLRKQDTLVIATMHKVLDVDVLPLNKRALKVARYLQIPVFDQASLLGPNATHFLHDRTHQNSYYSRKLSHKILDHEFSLPPESAELEVNFAHIALISPVSEQKRSIPGIEHSQPETKH